jgi:hypothetical protein
VDTSSSSSAYLRLFSLEAIGWITLPNGIFSVTGVSIPVYMDLLATIAMRRARLFSEDA